MKEPLLFVFYDQYMPHFLSLIIVNVDVFKKKHPDCNFSISKYNTNTTFWSVCLCFKSSYINIVQQWLYINSCDVKLPLIALRLMIQSFKYGHWTLLK